MPEPENIRKLPLIDDIPDRDIARVVNAMMDGYGNLAMPFAYGQIYTDDTNLSETFVTTGYTLIADANNMTEGFSRMAVLSLVDGRITPIDEALGMWMVYVGASFKSDGASRNIHLAIHKNGVKVDNISMERYASNVQTGNSSACGFVDLRESGDYVDLRGIVDTGTVTVDFNHLQITMIRIGH